MIEIRWHARAGQGAKTAAQLYAVAMLRAGKSVQAFPEYGPERRGAPVRAYTRVDDRPIRRHDAIEHPDAVVVLEPSLLHDASVTDGLRAEGLLLVNAEPSALEGAVCVPAEKLAGSEPPLDELVAAASETLGKKVAEDEIRAALAAGFEEVACLV